MVSQVWDPMPELTITSPYVYSRVDYITCSMGTVLCEATVLSLVASPHMFSPVCMCINMSKAALGLVVVHNSSSPGSSSTTAIRVLTYPPN
jgi:hypothetical protein